MPTKPTRNLKKALTEFPLFANLAPNHLSQLAQAARSIVYPKGQAIYRPGDPASELYFLLSGQVTLSLSSNRGNEKIIDILEAGSCFGEAELFGTRSYSVAALAAKPSQVLGIGRDSLLRIMAIYPCMTLRVIEILARRQIGMETELATRRFCSGGQRVLEFMLQLAGPDRDQAGETLVKLNLSKKVLASRFDMQPETLSRTLRGLTAAGLIVVDRSEIRLRNAAIAGYLDVEASPQLNSFPRVRRLPRIVSNGYRGKTAACASRRQGGVSRGHGDAINMAGRQRMLSQRMAKSWLMLDEGLLTRQSTLILKQSIDIFDRQLMELDDLASSAESSAAFAELAGLWPRYRALLEDKPCPGAARTLFGINEEVLDAAQKLTLSFERIDGTRKGKMINLAGRERMLSQRMAKLFMFRHMGINARQCRAELDQAQEEFSTALARLTADAHAKPGIHDQLESVTGHWYTLQTAIAADKDHEFAPAARKVFKTSEHLLTHMDAAVELYLSLPD